MFLIYNNGILLYLLLATCFSVVKVVSFVWLQVGMEVAPHLKESLNKNFFDFLLTFKQVRVTLAEQLIDLTVTRSRIHETQLDFQVEIALRLFKCVNP